MSSLLLITLMPTAALAAQTILSPSTGALDAFALGQVSTGTPKPAKLPIVPEPLEYTFGDTLIYLAHDFRITLSDELEHAGGDVRKAADRTEHEVMQQTHQWLSIFRGAEFWRRNDDDGKGFMPCTRYLDELQISLTPNSDDVRSNRLLTILGGATAPAAERVKLEKYELHVPLDGPATLTAGAALGLLRGLTTFEHLFYRLDEGDQGDQEREVDSLEDVEMHGRVYAPFAPYHIKDQPAMGWRGLMLDTARNYLSVKAIKRTLDTMSMVKMTPLHWHITDSDSWPLDLPGHPEVARAGAYDRHKRYTTKQVQDIVAYAGERGVDVIVEVDMPGHTAAIALSHPEHVACFGWYWDDYAAKPPAGQLRFANEETARWARGYVEELVGSVKSSYVHTGGDEASKACIDDDEPTQKALKDRNMTVNEAMDSFHAEIHGPIRAANKTPVVWQEAALDYGDMPSLRDTEQGGDRAIVHVWRNMKHVTDLLDRGFSLVLAPTSTFYLDWGNGAWLDVKTDDIERYDPYMTWRHIMAFNPYTNITSTQRGQILGGQVQAWAEQTDEHNLDSQLWPRAAAACEVFWGGDRKGAYPRDAREYMRAMHDMRYRMVERGTEAKPLAPHWCAVNPGGCAKKDEG